MIDNKTQAYLEQVRAHSEEGPIGEPAAKSVLAIAQDAVTLAEKLSQTIYLYVPEVEMRKSLGNEAAQWVIDRKGGPPADRS